MDDAYVQEEEWEREGLLDPAWEKQQRKVSACAQSHCTFVLCTAIVPRVRLRTCNDNKRVFLRNARKHNDNWQNVCIVRVKFLCKAELLGAGCLSCDH